MARMVRWRRLSGQYVWRAKCYNWNTHKPVIDLSFKVYAGVCSTFVNKNCRLEVLEKHEGEKYAKHVIASIEFHSTYNAKATIDSLLQIVRTMNLSNSESRQWFLDTLNKINTEPAEKVSIESDSTRFYEYFI